MKRPFFFSRATVLGIVLFLLVGNGLWAGPAEKVPGLIPFSVTNQLSEKIFCTMQVLDADGNVLEASNLPLPGVDRSEDIVDPKETKGLAVVLRGKELLTANSTYRCLVTKGRGSPFLIHVLEGKITQKPQAITVKSVFSPVSRKAKLTLKNRSLKRFNCIVVIGLPGATWMPDQAKIAKAGSSDLTTMWGPLYAISNRRDPIAANGSVEISFESQCPFSDDALVFVLPLDEDIAPMISRLKDQSHLLLLGSGGKEDLAKDSGPNLKGGIESEATLVLVNPSKGTVFPVVNVVASSGEVLNQEFKSEARAGTQNPVYWGPGSLVPNGRGLRVRFVSKTYEPFPPDALVSLTVFARNPSHLLPNSRIKPASPLSNPSTVATFTLASDPRTIELEAPPLK